MGTASDKVTSVLVPGAEALDTGVSQMQQQLETQLPALSGDIETLYTGINSVAQGMESLNGNMGTIAAGAQSVSQGINAIAANTGTLYGGAEAVYTYLSGISTTDAGIADTTSSQDEITTLQNLIASGTVTGGNSGRTRSGDWKPVYQTNRQRYCEFAESGANFRCTAGSIGSCRSCEKRIVYV